jgi:hypothetical protein
VAKLLRRMTTLKIGRVSDIDAQEKNAQVPGDRMLSRKDGKYL